MQVTIAELVERLTENHHSVNNVLSSLPDVYILVTSA